MGNDLEAAGVKDPDLPGQTMTPRRGLAELAEIVSTSSLRVGTSRSSTGRTHASARFSTPLASTPPPGAEPKSPELHLRGTRRGNTFFVMPVYQDVRETPAELRSGGTSWTHEPSGSYLDGFSRGWYFFVGSRVS